jgi:NAD(P)-dependent dehydrogenase (short-subunit alcohol dehydrogenase family)
MPTALVTGPSRGIGLATAIGLARAGHHVIAAGRSAERVGVALDQIAASGGSAEFLALDLASLSSVREAAGGVLGSGREIDIVICNAGIGVDRRGLTEDGFEVHFGINHLGHHLLTRELGPVLRPGSRVVSVTSAMHHRAKGIDFARVRKRTRLTGLAEYSVSKLANVLFIRELARHRPDIQTFAVHPGLVGTSLIPGPLRLLGGSGMLTPEQGADTVLWCATSDDVGSDSGLYYQQRSIARPSPVAEDDALARELWERSEAWTVNP